VAENGLSIAARRVASDQPNSGKLSEILSDMAADEARERVSVADLLQVTSDRAFGALIFIFAATNVLPMPPGTSAILGAPLVVLAAQLALGRRSPWLPKFIRLRSMARSDFAALIGRVAPWLGRAERLLKPRLSVVTLPPFEQAIATVCLLLAIILLLPIPLGNILPAFAISLMALSIIERDGLAAILGLVAAVISVAVAWGVIYALVKSVIYLLGSALTM